MNIEMVDGFYCQQGSSDRIAVDDTRRLFNKPGPPGPGDRVWDLGAHIGSFTRRALDAGVDLVAAFEPDPDNAELFRANVDIKDDRVHFFQAAVSHSSVPVDLYLGKTHGHSIVPAVGSGRPTISVPSWTLAEINHPRACPDPTYVKIDIEGAEYSLDLPTSLPDSVSTLFIEFHLTYGQRYKGEQLKQFFISAGWTPLWETNWNRGYVEGVWVR